MELHAVPIQAARVSASSSGMPTSSRPWRTSREARRHEPPPAVRVGVLRGQRPVPRAPLRQRRRARHVGDHRRRGHRGRAHVVFVREGYPINVLNQVKAVPEVCTIHCATANPVEVLVAETDLGRGVVGVVDGFVPAGVESDDDVAERKATCARSATSSTSGRRPWSRPRRGGAGQRPGLAEAPAFTSAGGAGVGWGRRRRHRWVSARRAAPAERSHSQRASHRSDPPAGGPSTLSSAPSGRDRRPPPRDTGSSEFSTGLTAELLAGRGESAHAGGETCGGMRWQSSWL